MADWKERVRKYEEQGRRFFDKSLSENNLGTKRELQEKGVTYLKNAGDLYIKQGRKNKALKIYNFAYQYAWPAKSKKEIMNKIYKTRAVGPLSARRGKRLSTKRGGLEKGLEKVLSFTSIGCLAVALLFVSFNLTGYVIGKGNVSAFISVSLFVLGIIFALVYFKEKDKKDKN